MRLNSSANGRIAGRELVSILYLRCIVMAAFVAGYVAYREVSILYLRCDRLVVCRETWQIRCEFQFSI